MFAPCHYHGWAPVPTAEVVMGLLAAVIYRPPSKTGRVKKTACSGKHPLHCFGKIAMDLPKNRRYAFLYAETLLT